MNGGRTWRTPVVGFVLVIALLEAAHLRSHGSNPGELHLLAVAYGLSVLLAAALGLGFVIGSIRRGLLLVAAAWTFLCGASIAKRQYLGAPLYPWDLLRIREVLGIWDQMPDGLRVVAVVATGALAAAVIAAGFSGMRIGSSPAARLRRLVVGYKGGFNFLGPTILRAAGVAPRCQFELLEPLHARVDLIHAGFMMPGADPRLASEVSRYWSLTHRLLLERRP